MAMSEYSLSDIAIASRENGFGVAVPGATQTVTAAAAGTVSVNIPAIVRNQCCDSTSTLTLVITSATVPATVTIDNTAVVVTKI